MVQVEGSNLWLPLREFLAAEREAAFRASPRRTARTREELPLIPPPPRKGEKEPPRAEPVGGAPFGVEPLAAEPAAAPSGTPQPTVRTREELPLTPPPRRERRSRRRRAGSRRGQQDEPQSLPRPVAPAPIGQPRGVDVLAAEPVVPSRKPALPPATRPDDSAPPIPLVPLDEAPLTPAVPLAKESRPKPQAEAFVPSAPGHLDADAEELPVIPLKPLDEQDRERSPRISWAARDEAHETGGRRVGRAVGRRVRAAGSPAPRGRRVSSGGSQAWRLPQPPPGFPWSRRARMAGAPCRGPSRVCGPSCGGGDAGGRRARVHRGTEDAGRAAGPGRTQARPGTEARRRDPPPAVRR